MSTEELHLPFTNQAVKSWSDHLNSIAGTEVRHTDMKLALHHPCTGLLCNIALLRINYFIYLERKTFSQVSPVPFLKWIIAAGMVHASVGGKNEKNCSDFTRNYSVACKQDSVTYRNTALNFKGVSLLLLSCSLF